MAQRRVSYYTISVENPPQDFSYETFVTTIFNFIGSQTLVNRKQDMGDDRFCFLSAKSYDPRTHISRGIFKSAKHSYRAPLIDRITLNERENPKTLDEGEVFKTHFVMKYRQDEILTVIESALNLLTIKSVVDYLNLFVRKYDLVHPEDPIGLQLKYELVPEDDFGQALANMDRVKAATVFFHKEVLGSEALGFAQELNDVQEEVEVTLKAKRNLSITQQIVGALGRLNGGQSQITKIRVKGSTDNVESVIDTSVIVKKTYIDVNKNTETGEYESPAMLTCMQELLEDM
jgi:hypothetical protein